MRFERLDLNLLVVLDALLAERSVSMAAGAHSFESICDQWGIGAFAGLFWGMSSWCKKVAR